MEIHASSLPTGNIEEGSQQSAGLRFVALQLEKLASDWSRLANHVSRCNYYLPDLTEEQILEISEQLSLSIEQAKHLILGAIKAPLSSEEIEAADQLMNLALYAEHSIQPVRRTTLFKSLVRQENMVEKSINESAEDLFVKELSEILGGEEG
ncbi:hypothetical protein FAI41_01560 [Acetobacteraceae bacterium]|nr:hypothetical protein FAI41_01560 [Acetobacteraceae bacterium]